MRTKILMFLGILFLLSLISTIFLLIVAQNYQPAKYATAVTFHLMLFSFSMFFLWGKDTNETIKKLGLLERPVQQVVYGVIGFFVLMVISILLNIILYYFKINDTYRVLQTVKDLPFYLVIFAIFFAPISEEMFFRVFLIEKIEALLSLVLSRGCAQNQQCRSLYTLVAIIISSTIFALSHFVYGSVAQIVGVFFIALFLGWLYKYSKSVIPIIIAHFLFNLTSFIIMKMLYGV
jgi:membrane protease YdiL (CAAX protease family)